MADPAARQRFGPAQRLHRKAEFDNAFKEGVRAFVHGLVIYILPAPDRSARLGLVTSRRFGNAVRRNRARRLLREAFRLEQALLPALDIVAVPQAGQFPDQLADVRRLFLAALAKALQRAAPRSSPKRNPA